MILSGTADVHILMMFIIEVKPSFNWRRSSWPPAQCRPSEAACRRDQSAASAASLATSRPYCPSAQS